MRKKKETSTRVAESGKQRTMTEKRCEERKSPKIYIYIFDVTYADTCQLVHVSRAQ
jgi:hypothetical protein